jgi:ComF family protein
MIASKYISILYFPVKSFLDFLSPSNCEVCGKYIGDSHQILEFICDTCIDALPSASPPEQIMNRLITFFSPDNLAISNACALFSVADNHKFMEAIYSLKYRGFTRIGYQLGKLLGKRLIQYNLTDYHFIVPVPIHPARKRERGYNQSFMIAQGTSTILNIPINQKIIKRKIYTQTQTVLNKYERQKNVSEAFAPFSNNIDIINKKILLLDDVLTTGSTLNSCANTLLEMGAIRVDIATIATAS